MASSSFSGSFSDALPILNSMSSLINPYPVVSQAISKQMDNALHLSVLNYATALTIIHSIIIFQASLVFILKFWRRVHEGISFFPWKKDYMRNQTHPHWIPNGNLFNDLLQILSSAGLEWFVSIVHRACTDPESVSPPRLQAAVFWVPLVFVPVLLGLWLNGWSCIYIGFFSPSRTEEKGIAMRFLQHPLVMNSLCLGTPILFITYLISMAIKLTISLKRTIKMYSTLIETLATFSKEWKPNDPQSLQRNQIILSMLTSVSNGGVQIGILFQRIAYSLTVLSACVILVRFFFPKQVHCAVRSSSASASGELPMENFFFQLYTTAMWTLRKMLKQLLRSRGANNKNSNSVAHGTKEDFEIWGSESSDAIGELASHNKQYKDKIQRTYYLVSASSFSISLSMGLFITACLIVALKGKQVLFDVTWQRRAAKLATGSSVVSSVSLTVQNILLIWNETLANIQTPDQLYPIEDKRPNLRFNRNTNRPGTDARINKVRGGATNC